MQGYKLYHDGLQNQRVYISHITIRLVMGNLTYSPHCYYHHRHLLSPSTVGCMCSPLFNVSTFSAGRKGKRKDQEDKLLKNKQTKTLPRNPSGPLNAFWLQATTRSHGYFFLKSHQERFCFDVGTSSPRTKTNC